MWHYHKLSHAQNKNPGNVASSLLFSSIIHLNNMPHLADLSQKVSLRYHAGKLARNMFLAEIKAKETGEQVPIQVPIAFVPFLEDITFIAKLCAAAWKNKGKN